MTKKLALVFNCGRWWQMAVDCGRLLRRLRRQIAANGGRWLRWSMAANGGQSIRRAANWTLWINPSRCPRHFGWSQHVMRSCGWHLHSHIVRHHGEINWRKCHFVFDGKSKSHLFYLLEFFRESLFRFQTYSKSHFGERTKSHLKSHFWSHLNDFGENPHWRLNEKPNISDTLHTARLSYFSKMYKYSGASCPLDRGR